ncbi:MAG: hypothetical protein ACK4LQ_09790 [Pararhodobacter sp.]
MRTRNGYVGAALLYGTQPPALPHVLQFLLHDLYLEGRLVGGVQLKGPTLRLRFEGYELILTQSDQPLPARALDGALRPRRAAGERTEAPPPADLARGRVLHALRSHRHALSVLLRARGGRRSEDPPDALLHLTSECRAMLEAVIEAMPPRAVVWQPGAVAFTCEEFLATRADALLDAGDRANVLCLSAHAHAAADRPALADWSDWTDGTEAPPRTQDMAPAAPAARALNGGQRALSPPPAATPRAEPAKALTGTTLPPHRPRQAAFDAEEGAYDALPPPASLPRLAPGLPGAGIGAVTARRGGDFPAPSGPPQRSAGRLFGTGRQPAALPRLYRQDERLTQALRSRPAATPKDQASAPVRANLPLRLARALNGLTLLLSGMLLLPLLGGLL